jgi:hypothetical protein
LRRDAESAAFASLLLIAKPKHAGWRTGMARPSPQDCLRCIGCRAISCSGRRPLCTCCSRKRAPGICGIPWRCELALTLEQTSPGRDSSHTRCNVHWRVYWCKCRKWPQSPACLPLLPRLPPPLPPSMSKVVIACVASHFALLSQGPASCHHRRRAQSGRLHNLGNTTALPRRGAASSRLGPPRRQENAAANAKRTASPIMTWTSGNGAAERIHTLAALSR